MRVLLVFPQVKGENASFCPLGILYIASSIRDKYEVEVIDDHLERNSLNAFLDKVCKFNPDYFGKYGFNRNPCLIKQLETINIGELEEYILKYKDAFQVEDGKVVVDATEIGFEKVLGKGRISTAMVVKAVEFSEGAKEKIEAAGGEFVEL